MHRDRGWCQTVEEISRVATVEQPKAAGFPKSEGTSRQIAWEAGAEQSEGTSRQIAWINKGGKCR